MNIHENELPPLPSGYSPTVYREMQLYAEQAIEADRQRRGEPVAWENFPGYLIDKCEGETITEEGLQRALADMLADPYYAPQPAIPVPEPFAYATHHDEPMLFLTHKEAAEYCDEDESPIPLYDRPQCAGTEHVSSHAQRLKNWALKLIDDPSCRMLGETLLEYANAWIDEGGRPHDPTE